MTHFSLPADWLERRVRIALIGAGGTGSQLADQLASLHATLVRLEHPGFDVHVYDHDSVSASNCGRQRYTASDIGLNKSQILVHRLNIFYGVNWTAVPRAFDPRALRDEDLIITAVDKAMFRVALGDAAKQSPRHDGKIWIDVGNGPVTGQCVLGHLANSTNPHRLPNVLDLYPELRTMRAADAEAPSCSTEEAIRRQEWPVNRAAALLASELLWTLFRKGRIEHHGAFFSLNPFTMRPLPIDPAAWAFLGYVGPSSAAALVPSSPQRSRRTRHAAA